MDFHFGVALLDNPLKFCPTVDAMKFAPDGNETFDGVRGDRVLTEYFPFLYNPKFTFPLGCRFKSLRGQLTGKVSQKRLVFPVRMPYNYL
jgi:hypothetical protein